MRKMKPLTPEQKKRIRELEEEAAVQGLQSRSVLPALRNPAECPGSGSGLQTGQGAFRDCPL